MFNRTKFFQILKIKNTMKTKIFLSINYKIFLYKRYLISKFLLFFKNLRKQIFYKYKTLRTHVDA